VLNYVQAINAFIGGAWLHSFDEGRVILMISSLHGPQAVFGSVNVAAEAVRFVFIATSYFTGRLAAAHTALYE
jgi:hypothetical protein